MKKTFSLWNRFRDVFSNLGHHPSYDWYFSLACLGILSIGAVALSGYIYYALALRAAEPVDSTTSPAKAFDREALSKALEDMRRADASAAVVPASVLADPSRR